MTAKKIITSDVFSKLNQLHKISTYDINEDEEAGNMTVKTFSALTKIN